MTKKEAAIISAYTGILIGDFGELHSYIESLMNRPVYVHELPELADLIKEKSTSDFMALKVEGENA